jgi:lysophospholipase L1-like esterase
MRCSIGSSFTALLICAVLTASAALGQSLSIVKKGESNYWIEASAPANTPYALQASENLHLWADIRSEVQGSYSRQLTNAGVSHRYFRLISPPSVPPIRVLIISDSMASDCCGWGGGIYGYFKPNATVVNYAMAWASTKIFLQSAEMEQMLLLKPDYVLMQYGYIDGGLDPDRSTSLQEFGKNLRTIAQKIRDFNGTPILISLHASRLWDENGKLIPGGQSFNNMERQVAAEFDAPFIDLYQITVDLFSKLGPDGTEFMRFKDFGPGDFMHFSPLGAQYISRLIVNALPDNLGPYLIDIFDPPPVP